jgi:hypothetical protein
MRLREALLLIAYLGVVLWLARDHPLACEVFCFAALPAIMSVQFVEHLQLRPGAPGFGFSEKVAAYLLGFLLSLFFLVSITFIVFFSVVGLIWLCTGMY